MLFWFVSTVLALPLLDSLDSLDGQVGDVLKPIGGLDLGWDCPFVVPLKRRAVSLQQANLAQHNQLKSFVAIKYGIAPPFRHSVDLTTVNEADAPVMQDDQTWSLSVNGEQQLVPRIGYLTGVISIGDQNFTVDFDTGSSDLWIPSVNCTQFCHGKHLYGPLNATEQGHFSLTYGDGSTTVGTLFNDSVQIGEIDVYGQTIGAALQLSSSFASTMNGQEQFMADGIVGLGWPGLSSYSTNARPWFFSAIAQGAIDDQRFAFNLSPGSESLVLGGVSEDEYTGEITYTNVTETTYWRVTADAILVNNTPVLTSMSMIVDSGTTLVLGPRDLVKQMLSVPGITNQGQGDYSFTCDDPPQIAFQFSGKAFAFSARSINQGRLGADDTVDGRTDQCLLAISGMDMNFFIAGDAFMSNVYTIFDVGQKRVGFADLAM